ncbi:alpha/beta hydrolase [Clostridium sp. 1001283B150210_160208_E6]|uniref:alpha/beta fold hydrolase n=1 Tax=Clostridium sp. 1001283B150210_160208_E6 TaxID=2787129 RepID=UPI0018AAE2BA|nr:alpha/beta hydrolase [Clostridium sp. 1001283B150210_160208_E6]
MSYYVKSKDGTKLYVEDLNKNSNKTIVFLHGWPGSHELFEYQYDYFIKEGYRCIGIDQRGFGKSDKPPKGYDYNTLADDVKEVVEKLCLKDICLVGHSTGGAIAVRYMARHKGFNVAKLVLCAAAAPSLIKRRDFPYGIKKEVVENIINGTYTDRPKMLDDFGKIFFYRKISIPFSNWFFSLGLQAAGWATAEIAQTWINECLFEDLKSIHIPTLILQGVHDQVVLPELSEQQNKAIKNSKLIKFKKSGHGLFYDEKDRFNNELKTFIDN